MTLGKRSSYQTKAVNPTSRCNFNLNLAWVILFTYIVSNAKKRKLFDHSSTLSKVVKDEHNNTIEVLRVGIIFAQNDLYHL